MNEDTITGRLPRIAAATKLLGACLSQLDDSREDDES